MSEMDMARYGGECWSGCEEVGQITSLIDINFMTAVFLPDPAHSETADVMKSMMYFDPPLHILTGIHLNI